MENKRRSRRVNRKGDGGIFHKLFVNTGNPEAIENQDWYLDTPDVRLTRIFSVVLILHIIAVGGILAFKMIDKAASPDGGSLATAKLVPRSAKPAQKEFAGKISNTPLTVTVPSVTPEARKDRYCVIPGDTLSEIAVKLGVTTSQLKMTNHITSPDELIPGMWLKIPVPVVLDPANVEEYDRLPDHPVQVTAQKEDQINPTAGTAETVTGQSDIIYQIQKGDTAWGISQRFGIHHGELLRYNGIDRPELLQVGQVLNIPVK